MAGKLKPLDVERQITPGKYADGDGLYLIVAGPTSRNWSYRYWIDGKERWHGLGSFKDVSLEGRAACARRRAASVKGDRSTPASTLSQAKRSAREEAKAVEIADRGADVPAMRGTIHRRKLVDVERETPRPVAVLAQALRLPDDRPPDDRRDQAEPHLRSARADLDREARNREPGPRPDRNDHREERRRRRQGFPQSGRAHQAAAREAAKRPKRVVRHHPALPYAEAPHS